MDIEVGTKNGIQPALDRPRLSYSQMIAEALNQAENRMMPLSEIYVYISLRYPFYRMDVKGWQNSIRHNLSLNPSFYSVPRSKDSKGIGKFWTTNIVQKPKILKKRVWATKSPCIPHAAGGQKLYPCPMCSDSLTSLDEVHGHLRTRHGYKEKVFLCRLCHYTSPNRSLWLSHYSICQRYDSYLKKIM